MATKKTLNEAETLEQYRGALNNVENQSEIAAIMAEFGYDSEAINQSKALLTEIRQKVVFRNDFLTMEKLAVTGSLPKALAPNNKISGGKVLSSKVPKGSNRLKIALRNAANAIGNLKDSTPLRDFFHRIKLQKGRDIGSECNGKKTCCHHLEHGS